jgi:hypothetical protein
MLHVLADPPPRLARVFVGRADVGRPMYHGALKGRPPGLLLIRSCRGHVQVEAKVPGHIWGLSHGHGQPRQRRLIARVARRRPGSSPTARGADPGAADCGLRAGRLTRTEPDDLRTTGPWVDAAGCRVLRSALQYCRSLDRHRPGRRRPVRSRARPDARAIGEYRRQGRQWCGGISVRRGSEPRREPGVIGACTARLPQVADVRTPSQPRTMVPWHGRQRMEIEDDSNPEDDA